MLHGLFQYNMVVMYLCIWRLHSLVQKPPPHSNSGISFFETGNKLKTRIVINLKQRRIIHLMHYKYFPCWSLIFGPDFWQMALA